ncbi:MAG TPA: hypothetical protein VGP68_12790 [Gemmataceae bacterium]|nr:hypothetical protein [Gemmataceae bacterium]
MRRIPGPTGALPLDRDWQESARSDETQLRLRFSCRRDLATSEHDRMAELLEKGRLGKLSAQEEKEMDTYERLGSLLGILHSKARQALNKRAADS